jgi:AhpD family alkylhydroperoxidase
MKLVGHSPAALEGYLSLNGALAKGRLDVQLRERIALAVAEYNGCDYCPSAHDYLGRNVTRLSDGEIDAARDGRSQDARANAARPAVPYIARLAFAGTANPRHVVLVQSVRPCTTPIETDCSDVCNRPLTVGVIPLAGRLRDSNDAHGVIPGFG